MRRTNLRLTRNAASTLLATGLAVYPSGEARAHNLKVHQEFTEVAYAYLNAIKGCVPSPKLIPGYDLNACISSCKQQFDYDRTVRLAAPAPPPMLQARSLPSRLRIRPGSWYT